MIKVKPFKALRPRGDMAEECAALPYDVMSRAEAREMVKGKPYSFLHVDRAEVDLSPDTDIYSDIVYEKARANLDNLESSGVYFEDGKSSYYFYRQIMNGHAQTGIVGCASIDDYIENRIKKHEHTRADKEVDRIRHVDTCSAHTGPIFLTYKESSELDEIIENQTKAQPIYDFVAEDGVRHTVWKTDGAKTDEKIEKSFSKLDALYIADGHHRCASAVKVGLKRREEAGSYTGEEEFNFFLSVIFPSSSLAILDYNRLLRDLNGYTPAELLSIVEEKLGSVTEWQGEGPARPTCKHTVGMYLDGKWYCVRMHQELCNGKTAVERLDSMQDLMDVADSGDVMPPKSTWFEPKLRSGLLIHKI